ncbi:MAG: beta-N-acetylglucosaminidase domain-containing protein [Selenomonadaceae bacterium]|nr:beta-N-acetylglucosaminidase domain-containing protein [Selenomonadaceae bacterium]
MKKFLSVILLTAILSCGSALAVPIPLRGVVEGFYGTPWTFEDRADIIDFCRQNNFNSYIYAPKDDPYHREQWRKPYPADKLAEIKSLVAFAKKNNVRFIFAVSPGLDLNYKGDKGEEDFNSMIKKLDAMYKIGVRDFAIFFDDLKDDKGRHHEDGKLQAEFLNRVQKNLRGKYKDVAPLIMVPTEYFYLDMVKGDKIKPYTKDLAENLDSRIVILYTGRGVVCDGITDKELAEVNKIFGREVGVWWNYPVNDYPLTPDGNRNVKLALGAIEKLPTAKMTAIFFNPMQQVQLSKVSLATGAIYANNPASYDQINAWNKVLNEQFGFLAPYMKIFAEHSRHMENSWAKVGEPDAIEFATDASNLLYDFGKKTFIDFAPLERKIIEIERAADILLTKLPQKYLSECKPQLEQLKRIANADKVALESLKAGKLDPRLKILREEISANEKQAVLSEEAARKFIDDVIKVLDEQNKPKRKKK